MGPQLVRCGKGRMRFMRRMTVQMLQWGRNLFVAESRVLQVPHAEVFLASMGPQLVRCGKWHSLPVYRLNVIASMGPQLVRCGKKWAAFPPDIAAALLQWGRNLFVAEREAHAGCRGKVPGLQWGRNLFVAES